MRGLIRVAAGLGSGAAWLLLLEATDFNTITVGIGLLAGLVIMDRNRG